MLTMCLYLTLLPRANKSLKKYVIYEANRKILDMAWKQFKETLNMQAASDVWCLHANSWHPCAKKHTRRWRHTQKPQMLFSFSPSCLEQRVFLLVLFDPAEMSYICQRKGDPTGTKEQAYQRDITLSLLSPLSFIFFICRMSLHCALDCL